ncbi:MAG TPA: tRNA-uridine aminocarboxypropyltransferase [Bauldia sp.]|nr:tRNA-uridine aminocarboxypropyltransferase [Bauldia sp.]
MTGLRTAKGKTLGNANSSPAKIDNRVALLILQHPQEQDAALGSAQLAVASLSNATLKIGLSWPSLAKALGRAADPKRWAILHLGSARASDFPGGREIAVLDKKGAPVADQDGALADIDGIVVFDGTWSQAKTLWWRNAWVLKGKRVALNPKRPSLYGNLRREPRRQGLSTIEAAGMLLSRLEGRPEIETTLNDNFRRMLDNIRMSGVHVGKGAK